MRSSASGAAQAQIVEAIAEIHEAMLVEGDMEIARVLEPCDERNDAGAAAVRKALLASEDAMIGALQALPEVALGLMN